jgi:hypothetical protein
VSTSLVVDQVSVSLALPAKAGAAPSAAANAAATGAHVLMRIIFPSSANASLKR